ncbi:MFS transporter [Rhizoctonia solani AG-1 IA]|uniref:MFS transporter n=1 Tax=Thanatephorus cucumeris (strain AG1-IA) TaxID=983506 RepID=L8WWS9_THACA|nr:MFS transporter [Rhizoctonia solani AG-1 IA]
MDYRKSFAPCVFRTLTCDTVSVGANFALLSTTRFCQNDEPKNEGKNYRRIRLSRDLSRPFRNRSMDLRVCPSTLANRSIHNDQIDRVNIGNARLFGLEADLGMAGSQYQTAVSVLFVTYLNLLIETSLAPVAFITFAWGIVATLTGIVQSYGGLIACRLILGLFEAGLFVPTRVPHSTPINLMNRVHAKRARAPNWVFVRFVGASWGMTSSGVLGIVGDRDRTNGWGGRTERVSPRTSQHNDRKLNYLSVSRWRWIIIIEQVMFPAYGSRLVIPFVLPDSPDTAPWLTPAEKAYIRARKLRQQGETADAQKFHWSDVRKCFMDPKLTVPCYILGAITYLVIAFLSDRYQIRGWFCVAGGTVSVLGYIILLVPVSSGVHYMGCFFVAMGLYVVVGIPLSWLPNNIPRYGKRTSATGFQLMIGNASGVMAPFLYATNEKPRYIRGHAVSLAMVAFASGVYAVLAVSCVQDYKLAGKTDEEVDAMGDESPRFRWVPSLDFLGETK